MSFDPTLRARLKRNFHIREAENDARGLAMYDPFLGFFQKHIAVKKLQQRDAKIAVILTFTLMQPVAFNPECFKYFPLAKRLLERDKTARLTATEIDRLKAFVGGSLIATSKFLHFLNPRRYAMWDTNVAKAAYRCTWQQCNRADRYIEYLDDIKELKLDDKTRARVRNAIGRTGALRCKEFALYQLGIAESTRPTRTSNLSNADFPFVPERYTLDLGIEEDGRV